MSNQKVNAFTILEVTVTMLIAGLLIAITYTSYSIVIKSYRSFTNKNDDMAVVVSLDHLLTRDFGQADIVLKDEDGISIKKGGLMITYIFTPDFIVRNAARVDTFKLQTQEVNTAFENTPVNEIQATEEGNRIDDISFTLLFQTEKIPYHYHKLYSSANLIKRNANAIN
jgi:Tfp pilus assembly protein PilE